MQSDDTDASEHDVERESALAALGVGTLSGVAQACAAVGLMMLGATAAHSPRPIVHPTFWIAMATIVVCCIGLGVWADLRRRDVDPSIRALDLARARWAVVLVALVVPVTWGAGYANRVGALMLALCPAFVVWVLTALALDRLIGPTWVLVRMLRVERARRGWVSLVVLESEPSVLVEDARGRQLRVRAEVPLERGRVFADLRRTHGVEGYRLDVPAIVRAVESPELRASRARMIGAATLGLLSGLAWLAVPFFPTLGAALCDHVAR
ncbi:MAG: hypothetical protein M3Y87_00660 [Myxococcota bacterium]|nr:hypothetical protein [Myxococcota bacterium]